MNAINHRTRTAVLTPPPLLRIIKVTFIVINLCAIVTGGKIKSKQIRSMETIDISPDPVYRVLLNNSDIYVGGRNAIYKLSTAELAILDKIKTGPVNDSINCPPYPLACDWPRKLTDNENQILLIKDDLTSKFPALIACGTVYQGMCMVINGLNFSSQVSFLGPKNDTMSFVASKRSSFVVVAPPPAGQTSVKRKVRKEIEQDMTQTKNEKSKNETD